VLPLTTREERARAWARCRAAVSRTPAPRT
jgi:hypothetical protein